MSSLGYIIGPLLGGFFTDSTFVAWFSFSLPFYLAGIGVTLTALLAAVYLQQPTFTPNTANISIAKQLNIIRHLQFVVHNRMIKYVLLSLCVFFLAIDLFYEFGPVYLSANWQMTPWIIGCYTAVIAVTLAMSFYWISPWLTQYFSNRSIISGAALCNAVALVMLVVFPKPIDALFLFALLGFSIAIIINTLTVQLSDAAAANMQAETMGTQLALRMLGDSILCLVGGAMLVLSVNLPLLLGAILTLGAGGYYYWQEITASPR